MPEHAPEHPLQEATAPFFVGIDIGGTNIKIGLVDRHNRCVAYRKIATQADDGPQQATKRIGQTVAQLTAEVGLKSGDLVRTGLATPGPMDLKNGRLLDPGNLPTWHGAHIRDLVSDATSLPVTFANDANAAAYGEFCAGAGEAYQHMVMLTLGTGVGAGIISNGQLLVGAHGAGGECGHIPIDVSDDAPVNSLGLSGTLEGYVGAYGLVHRTQLALNAESDDATPAQQSPLQARREHGTPITPLAVAQAADDGDPLAMEIIMETAKYLACGIAAICLTVDPECVVLGGAMNFGGRGHHLGERFLLEVQQQTRPRLFAHLRDVIQIEFATLGGDAGFLGAAGLARQEWEQH